MYVKEFGEKDKPTIVMLAPMMVSGQDLYNLISPYLNGAYRIISPDQGGHGKAGAYVSAEDEYLQLKRYLKSQGIKDIKLIYGASLGVAVAYRLVMDSDFNVDYVWFDGVALNRNAVFMDWMMRKLFRKKKRMLSKTKAEASESLVKMYGYDFAKMMTKNFERITESDIDAICYACCHYDLKNLPGEEQRKIHIEYGEKDFDLGLSKKALKKYFPEVNLVIRKGHPHCGYMANHRKEYVEELERFISVSRSQNAEGA